MDVKIRVIKGLKKVKRKVNARVERRIWPHKTGLSLVCIASFEIISKGF
jgi:hypothetical protein